MIDLKSSRPKFKIESFFVFFFSHPDPLRWRPQRSLSASRRVRHLSAFARPSQRPGEVVVFPPAVALPSSLPCVDPDDDATEKKKNGLSAAASDGVGRARRLPPEPRQGLGKPGGHGAQQVRGRERAEGRRGKRREFFFRRVRWLASMAIDPISWPLFLSSLPSRVSPPVSSITRLSHHPKDNQSNHIDSGAAPTSRLRSFDSAEQALAFYARVPGSSAPPPSPSRRLDLNSTTEWKFRLFDKPESLPAGVTGGDV